MSSLWMLRKPPECFTDSAGQTEFSFCSHLESLLAAVSSISSSVLGPPSRKKPDTNYHSFSVVPSRARVKDGIIASISNVTRHHWTSSTCQDLGY